MKTLVLALAFMASACEHDPRFDHHVERRPDPVVTRTPAADAPGLADKTVERPAPVKLLQPKIVPLEKRTHRHH